MSAARSAVRRSAVLLALVLTLSVLSGLGPVAPASAAVPADGATFKAPDGRWYRMAGRAPILIVSWGNVGMTAAPTNPAEPPTATEWNVLKTRKPVNNTVVYTQIGSGARAYYRIIGGAAVRSTDTSGGVRVDPTTISRAGGAVPYANLAKYVPNNTYFKVGAQTYRVVESGRHYAYSGTPSGTFTGVSTAALTTCSGLQCEPWGVFESITGGEQQVRVTGWAMDSGTTEPVSIGYTIDGGAAGSVDRAATRPHAAAAKRYPGSRPQGFDLTIPVPAGAVPRTICLFAQNAGDTAGRQQPLSCKSATVTAPAQATTAAPGKVGKVKAKPKRGKAVLKWKAPSTGGPVDYYQVKASNGARVKTKGPVTKVVFKKRLRPGQRVSFRVCGYNSVGGLGECSRKSKKVRIR